MNSLAVAPGQAGSLHLAIQVAKALRVRRPDLTPTHVNLIRTAADLLGLHHKPPHVFSASVSQLVAETGLSKPTVIKARRELVVDGVFVLVRQGSQAEHLADDMTIDVAMITIVSARGQASLPRDDAAGVKIEVNSFDPAESSHLTPTRAPGVKPLDPQDPISGDPEGSEGESAHARVPPPPGPATPGHLETSATTSMPRQDSTPVQAQTAVREGVPVKDPAATDPVTASANSTKDWVPSQSTEPDNLPSPNPPPDPPSYQNRSAKTGNATLKDQNPTPVAAPPPLAAKPGNGRPGRARKRAADGSKPPTQRQRDRRALNGRPVGAPLIETELTEAHRETAKTIGLPAALIQPTWDKFLDHHRAKGSARADWFAAWRSWARDELLWLKRRDPEALEEAERAERDERRRETCRKAAEAQKAEWERQRMADNSVGASASMVEWRVDAAIVPYDVVPRPRPRPRFHTDPEPIAAE